MGMEEFRKVYMKELDEFTGRMDKEVDQEYVQADNIDKDLDDLPEHPRFGATLSVTARLAQLHCYEDKLVSKLNEQHESNLIRSDASPVCLSEDQNDEEVCSSGHKDDCIITLRKVSHSLNTAMAMLDHLECLDESTTSSLEKKNNVENYNHWSKLWVKSFNS